MRTLKLIPRPLRYVAGVILAGVTVLLLWAGLSAHGKTGYEFTKDVVVPLVSPIVAILVPTMLFYVIPLTQTQQKGALDLFTTFSGEDMRQARNEAWIHFVIERRNLPEAEQHRPLDDFLRHLFEQEGQRKVTPDLHEIYQKASRVLDFFAIVNVCVHRKSVDKAMVRSFLAFYYLWWRDEIMIPLRTRPLLVQGDPRYKPIWWDELTSLDGLCQPDGRG